MDPLCKASPTPAPTCQGDKKARPVAPAKGAGRLPQDRREPAAVRHPVKDIPRRLDVATDNIAEGTGKAVHGIVKTAVNAPVVAAEGVATAAVVYGGTVVLAAETIIAGYAAVAGVAVGLGIGAVELAGKGVQAVGDAAEAVGDATVKARRSAGELLHDTSRWVAERARRSLNTIQRAFGAGVDVVSPAQ